MKNMFEYVVEDTNLFFESKPFNKEDFSSDINKVKEEKDQNKKNKLIDSLLKKIRKTTTASTEELLKLSKALGYK